MISEEEKLAVVKMFCAYCRRTLRNARTDIIRKQAREARWETVFSDMHESELNRLASPDALISEEVVFEVMVAAVSGDPVAMQKVLAYFDGYMDQLCTHAFLDESGRVEYGVDTLRKTQLQGKLLAAMLRFEP